MKEDWINRVIGWTLLMTLTGLFPACSEQEEELSYPQEEPPRETYVPEGMEEVRTDGPDAFDYRQLFTDASCTELRPGITRKEINRCPVRFFQKMAWYMLYDRYPREFRIADFHSYPHPSIQSKTHKTAPYSRLDNPTGIAVAAGEELVVMARFEAAYPVTLRVQHLDKPGGDGFGGPVYPLHPGINRIRMNTPGLVYVQYHSPTLASLPDIRLHFGSGTVNGYFDSQCPAHQQRENELLEKAVYPYFDVLGKYIHVTFPTASFRTITAGRLRQLIDRLDELAYAEQLFMGLVKYDKLFRNRIYMNVMYHSYMYAAAFHTGFHVNTMSILCDPERLLTRCWGPAHEVGHVNQTRPGLKWHGMTEVTNNIMSLYVQTCIFHQPSRLQEINKKTHLSTYGAAWNELVVKQQAHNTPDVNVFHKLVPFWQLELYFGKVLGRTPLEQPDHGGFYPDVYEYIRTHANLPTAGEQQLEFTYIASRTAGMDLTDFFEKWGFLTPIDTLLSDYSKRQFTVRQEQIESIKQRIKALQLPKPDVPLEYLTDRGVELFRHPAPIQAGTVERENNRWLLQGWRQVVAFEIRENGPDGRLVGVAEGEVPEDKVYLPVPKEGMSENYRIFAVLVDNQRIPVDFPFD